MGLLLNKSHHLAVLLFFHSIHLLKQDFKRSQMKKANNQKITGFSWSGWQEPYVAS
jgi:hypothetical protein